MSRNFSSKDTVGVIVLAVVAVAMIVGGVKIFGIAFSKNDEQPTDSETKTVTMTEESKTTEPIVTTKKVETTEATKATTAPAPTEKSAEQIKAEAITAADIQSQQADYLGALVTIRMAIEKVGEDAELNELAAAYESAYQAQLTPQVPETEQETTIPETTVPETTELFSLSYHSADYRRFSDDWENGIFEENSKKSLGNKSSVNDNYGNMYIDATMFINIDGITQQRLRYYVPEYNTFSGTVAMYNPTKNASGYVGIIIKGLNGDEQEELLNLDLSSLSHPQDFSVDISKYEMIEIRLHTGDETGENRKQYDYELGVICSDFTLAK